MPPSKEIAGQFNYHFLKNGNSLLRDNANNYLHNQYLREPPVFTMYLPPVKVTEIEQYLKDLKVTDPDYDDIPPKLLIYTSLVSLPITHIINLPFKTRIFQHKFKKAKVMPLHKSGNKRDINNYRPISIYQCLAKYLRKQFPLA